MAGRLSPLRGEVWYADLDPVIGHDQGGRRPVLIVSTDTFGSGPGDLVIALAITSTQRAVRSQVPVHPPEGGLKLASFIKCQDIRSISKKRLGTRLGSVSSNTMAEVSRILRNLLDLW